MEFFNSAVEVLQTLVVALGAGLGVWGAVNLLEGYPSYRKARERMQELMKAQKNVEMFFADNRSEQEQQQTR